MVRERRLNISLIKVKFARVGQRRAVRKGTGQVHMLLQ